jgi:peroxiredoxin
MKSFYSLLIAAVFMFSAVSMIADHHITAEVDKAAPDFTLTDHSGNSHKLSDYRGKTVVLEWINFDCPYVAKHYGAGNMQELQERYTAQEVVWLAINSSAEGKQGCFTKEEISERVTESGAAMTAYLIDKDGTVGHMYGAKTTPNMFVIDGDGVLRYAGAIDDNPSHDPATITGATNYVAQALDEIAAGQAVSVKASKPYGCSVKYAK